jgi:hypothetical protein
LYFIVTAKQAFEENESETKSPIQKISNEPQSSLTNLPSSSDHIDLNRFYERAFFTTNDITVEVILDKDVLSWSAVSDQSR